jgi:hypothetical protein
MYYSQQQFCNRLADGRTIGIKSLISSSCQLGIHKSTLVLTFIINNSIQLLYRLTNRRRPAHRKADGRRTEMAALNIVLLYSTAWRPRMTAFDFP